MTYDARAELRGILHTVGDGVVVVDEKWRVLNLNAACAGLFGHRVHELIGRPVSSLFVSRGERKVFESIRQNFGTQVTSRDPSGRALCSAVIRMATPLVFEAPDRALSVRGLVRYVIVLRDVGARRRAERALQRAVLRDPLTRLFNRSAFADELRRALERAQRTGGGFALLLLDLDHFKEINNSVGHQAGDLLLRQTARRLREQVRRSDVLARLGGDEFAVLSDQAATSNSSIALAERLIEALARPFHIGGVEAHVGTSIGIATFPEDARDGDQLLGRADLAFTPPRPRAEARGGCSTPGCSRSRPSAGCSRSELWWALREGQLSLLYQPLICVADLEVAGFEALLRWNHPVRGQLEPQEFVPFAERHRLIGRSPSGARPGARRDRDPRTGLAQALPTAVNISTRIFDRGPGRSHREP